MSKRKNPDTSNDAYRAVTLEMLNNHHKRIVGALQNLGTAIYEQIADYTGMDAVQVGRRLIELERMKIVFKPGTKKKTKKNRDAYEYTLSFTDKKTETKGAKILKMTNDSKFVQPNLF